MLESDNIISTEDSLTLRKTLEEIIDFKNNYRTVIEAARANSVEASIDIDTNLKMDSNFRIRDSGGHFELSLSDPNMAEAAQFRAKKIIAALLLFLEEAASGRRF